MKPPWSLVMAVALLAACGGKSRPSHVTVTETLPSDPQVDGYVTDTGFVVQGQRPLAGDDSINQVARAFYRFPHPTVPAGAEIARAVLFVGQEGGAGTPYADLGPAVVDHLDLGGGLDAADFDAVALAPAHGILSATGTIEEKSLDVTALVRADAAAGRTRTDLRIRMTTASDGDAEDDFTIWNDAADSGVTGSVPRVVVTLRVPVP